MNAQDLPFTQLLDGAKQFIVPIFQRDYSWGTKHCLQLWNDILRVGRDANVKGHFLGSVVYIPAGETGAAITRWLLIDGQQRLATLSLLLVAFRERLEQISQDRKAKPTEKLPTPEEIDDYYLRNRHGKADLRNKLSLRRTDQETYTALIYGKDLPKNPSEHLQDTYEFFVERLAEADLSCVYEGIRKLVIVDVSLTRGQDDPQMIFESLNSTGLDLTQADLIRNFVLMRQDDDSQTQLYENYWQPIETAFGARYRSDFDKFVRDYLTLQLKPSKQLKSDEIYQHFRTFYYEAIKNEKVEHILADLKRFGGYYVSYSLGQEKDTKLREPFRRLRQIVEVASPLMLRLYDCYDRYKTITRSEFADATELLESFVFRRSVCDMQTRSLGQIFSSIAYRIREQDPLTSLKVTLYRQGRSRRFPEEAEFKQALQTRDVYDMRHCHYLLDRLENDSKERIDTTNFTIEHILPQNEKLRPEWQKMLGPDWKTIQQTWVHRLGNVTLTGYNSEYSDRSFSDKKKLKGGFNESPLRLNKVVREASVWTQKQIESRGNALATNALKIWRPLTADLAAVKAAELEELKSRAARYDVKKLAMEPKVRELFEKLRERICALDKQVVELCNEKSVTYRTMDYFVELIPRKNRLAVLLNLDFDECDDPSGRARDATENAFVINATEDGGVLFRVRGKEDLTDAMHLVAQAYERVSA
jgi:uncharacterized protein with ParB-like and HNH nuclease domain/predicted transport protein